MEKEPLVSVITPAFNAEGFIEATVRSVLSQTYKNLEVIIADDGSADRTGEIVKRLAAEDSRVKYIYQKNAGQSAARNTAIAAAKGEYLAFLDADDLFLPDKLEEQVGYLEAHPECGLCYCLINHFFSGDESHLYRFNVPTPSGFLFEKLLQSNFINPLTVVVRKKVIDEYGAFEPTFRRLDEQYLWLKLSFHNVQFCHLPKALGLYRVHKGSLSNDAVYFRDTEIQFLRLLETIRAEWLTPEEVRRYNINGLVVRTKRRILIGRIMAANNPVSRLLLKLYYSRRISRMIPVESK